MDSNLATNVILFFFNLFIQIFFFIIVITNLDFFKSSCSLPSAFQFPFQWEISVSRSVARGTNVLVLLFFFYAKNYFFFVKECFTQKLKKINLIHCFLSAEFSKGILEKLFIEIWKCDLSCGYSYWQSIRISYFYIY
jgi:ABC-type amino acid transport system permease subunit